MKVLSWALQVLGIGAVLGTIADLSVHAAVILAGSASVALGVLIERDA